MSEKFTTTIKGYAILLVFCVHTVSQFGVKHIQFIAAIGVSLFLVCSGYGIQKSYDKNGLKNYWKKKIITVFIPFWIVEIVAAIILKDSVSTLIQKLVFYKCNWYIQYILICYMLFWIVNIVGDTKIIKLGSKKKTFVLFILFIVWFILDSLFFFKPDAITLRGRQMLAFPFGVLLANSQYLEDTVLNNVKKKGFLFYIVVITILCMIIMYFSETTDIQYAPVLLQNIVSLFTVFPLSICFIGFVSFFHKIFINRLIGFFGIISYELFLVHCQLHGYMYIRTNIIIRYFVGVIVGTAILFLFDKFVLKKIRKMII